MTSLPFDSKSVQYIRYLIQKQLDAPRVSVLDCLDVATAGASQSFSEFCNSIESKNIVHVFLPVEKLNQPISDISSRGVRIHQRRGMRLRVGGIELDGREDESIQLVHCLVALGSPQNWQKFNENLEETEFETSIPISSDLIGGFNSICTDPSSGEYYVFNQKQIRTLHIVTINGGRALLKEKEMDMKCDLCKKEDSNVYCKNCRVKLCTRCDEASHRHNPLLQSHERLPIGEALALIESCPYHSKNKTEHFCPECGISVCFECKLSGNHSQGAYAKHTLIPIKDALRGVYKSLEQEPKEYARRRRAINRKMADAEARLRDVSENAKQVEARIMKIANDAIASLKAQAGEKILSIRSTQVELQRKLNEINRNQEFIEMHKEYSNPVIFIQSCSMNEELIRSEYKTDEDLPIDLYVQGDLAVAGGIRVLPRQLAEVPNGIAKRDLDFEEKNERVTESSLTEQPETKVSNQSNIVEHGSKGVHRAKLSSLAKKHAKRLNQTIDFQPFCDSKIITDHEQARVLYLSIPFKSIPQTQLLFSTERDGRSIPQMHRQIDGIGITIVLIKRGIHVFGGFAAAKWNNEDRPITDSPSTFIFSVTQDAFIPYKPNAEDSCFMKAGFGYLSFGVRDIRMENNFDHCTSELEYSYSAGFAEGSKEAKTFLAGMEKFQADIVEVWGFFSKT